MYVKIALQDFTTLGFEFSGQGFVVTVRRAGFTALGANFFTLGLENPGLGLEKAGVGFGKAKAGPRKKERGLDNNLFPFATANISPKVRNAKSAFSILTFQTA